MPTRLEAVRFLEEHAQELFKDVGSMLYVGHRHDTSPWWRTEFATRLGLIPGAGGVPQIDIVDIIPGNLPMDLVRDGSVRRCFHGDIRTYQTLGYGLVFWDEGPEHVSKEDALAVLVRLAEHNDHVLISCPWGHQPQGTGPDDVEFHHWAPQPADFESIGFHAEVFGTEFDGKGGGHGNLIAWH